MPRWYSSWCVEVYRLTQTLASRFQPSARGRDVPELPA